MNSKIYSRPRIKIPPIFSNNIGDKNLKRKQKIVKIFIIMVIAFSTVKIVLDAMNKFAFKDDTQVTKLEIEKKYSRTPRIYVKIEEY